MTAFLSRPQPVTDDQWVKRFEKYDGFRLTKHVKSKFVIKKSACYLLPFDGFMTYIVERNIIG